MAAQLGNNLPWIESPFFYTLLKNSSLSEEDKNFVKFFAEEGYVVFDTGIDHQILDEIVSELAPAFEKVDPSNIRIQDAWQFNEKVKSLAALDIVFEKLRLLYQREPIPFQTLNFPVGTQQNTHSDMIHFNSIPERFMCGVWIAFEDIHENNGPLHYYPQSHKLPFYDLLSIGVKASANREKKKAMMAYLENYEVFIQKMVQELNLKKETLNIKKGQAIIWSANLLHGGELIKQPGASRHSQVTHYYFEDCMYYSPKYSDIAINKIYLTDLVNIKTGEKLVNKYFDETVKRPAKLEFQFKTIKMLSKIAPLFPRSIVNIVRDALQK
jgi:ectoine hydroxylase-related dioxygenase (phytanoyl-CoA dioxygenase family)